MRRALVDTAASLAARGLGLEALEALAKDQEPTVCRAAALYIQELQGAGQKASI